MPGLSRKMLSANYQPTTIGEAIDFLRSAAYYQPQLSYPAITALGEQVARQMAVPQATTVWSYLCLRRDYFREWSEAAVDQLINHPLEFYRDEQGITDQHLSRARVKLGSQIQSHFPWRHSDRYQRLTSQLIEQVASRADYQRIRQQMPTSLPVFTRLFGWTSKTQADVSLAVLAVLWEVASQLDGRIGQWLDRYYPDHHYSHLCQTAPTLAKQFASGFVITALANQYSSETQRRRLGQAEVRNVVLSDRALADAATLYQLTFQLSTS